jgi:hypothetical protein
MTALAPTVPSLSLPHAITFKGFGLRSMLAALISLILVVAGIVIVSVGFQASSQVRSTLAAEHITLTPDAPGIVGLPGGTAVNSASTAHAMAAIIRHHTLAATDGAVYADMGQYLNAKGQPTSDKTLAAIDPVTKQPVSNSARNIWVTSTTWRTSLGLAEMGFKLSMFVSGMGGLIILLGLGFAIVGIKRT